MKTGKKKWEELEPERRKRRRERGKGKGLEEMVLIVWLRTKDAEREGSKECRKATRS